MGHYLKPLLMAVGLCFIVTQAQAVEFNYNGFFSFGYADIQDDDVQPGLVTEELAEDQNFEVDSILGLQGELILNDYLSATVQVVSRGTDNYDPLVEWAFLNIGVTENFDVRLGRFRIPFFAFSETLEVGYSYPWVRPPLETYRIDFTSANGISLLYHFTLGRGWDIGLQYIYGLEDQRDFDIGNLERNADIRDLNSFVIDIEKDWFSFRASYHVLQFSLDLADPPGFTIGLINTIADPSTAAGLPAGTLQGLDAVAETLEIDGVRTEFFDASITIDYADYLFIFEWSATELDGGLTPDDIAWFVTFGKRFGRFLPHFTYAQLDSVADGAQLAEGVVAPEADIAILDSILGPGLGAAAAQELYAGIAQSVIDVNTFDADDRRTYTAGLRFDVSEYAALKGEVTFVEDDTFLVNEDGLIYSFVIDIVF